MTGFQKKIILRAMDNERYLTEWECEFIDNLSKKDDEYKITPKQNEVLNRILNKLDFG